MNLCLEYMQECGFVLCLLSIMFLKRITFFIILACKQHNIYILTQWLFCIFILSWMQIAFQLNFDLSHWQNIWAECQLIGLPIKKIFFVLCDSTDKNMVTFFKISNSKWTYNIPLMSGLGKCHLGFFFLFIFYYTSCSLSTILSILLIIYSPSLLCPSKPSQSGLSNLVSQTSDLYCSDVLLPHPVHPRDSLRESLHF